MALDPGPYGQYGKPIWQSVASSASIALNGIVFNLFLLEINLTTYLQFMCLGMRRAPACATLIQGRRTSRIQP
jgi:hypothetical protein